MAVKVADKKSGQAFTGKFADIKGENVHLWSGSMADKKGGLRG